MGQKKTTIYEDLLQRHEAAASAGFHYEACWFAFAVFEDRTRSIVSNSGNGQGSSASMSDKLQLIFERHEARVAKVVAGRPVRVKGKKEKVPKYPQLQTLRRTDILLIRRWTRKRNKLAHALASGQLNLNEADEISARLSLVAGRLLRRVCSAARRLKKLRTKKGARNTLYGTR